MKNIRVVVISMLLLLLGPHFSGGTETPEEILTLTDFHIYAPELSLDFEKSPMAFEAFGAKGEVKAIMPGGMLKCGKLSGTLGESANGELMPIKALAEGGVEMTWRVRTKTDVLRVVNIAAQRAEFDANNSHVLFTGSSPDDEVIVSTGPLSKQVRGLTSKSKSVLLDLKKGQLTFIKVDAVIKIPVTEEKNG